MKQALKSQRVLTPTGIRPATIVHENGRILSLDADALTDNTVDSGSHYILPGLIDTHVHINEPGRTEWEGFHTASRAAAAGGITCFIDMPLNCIPATTTVAALEEKRAAARHASLIDYAFWGGAVHDNAADLLPLAQAGVRGFKSFLVPPGIDEFSMVGEAELRLAMPIVAATGLPLLVHAEHPAFLRPPLGIGHPAWLASRPHASELEAIRLLIRLCRDYKCPLHIVHLSSAEALPEIKAARAEGLPLTVETCPHYLCLSSEEIPPAATEYKCAPPIREAANRELLWQALREGVIDLIATDHSPCPPRLKLRETGDFINAWGGIASLSVAFPLIWTEARRRGFNIDQVVHWMSQAPAKLAGIHARKGRIAPGFDADFTIFDPDAEWRIHPSDLHFRHPVSPYLGRTVQGKVITTIVRGQTVYNDAAFAAKLSGLECPASHVRSAV